MLWKIVFAVFFVVLSSSCTFRIGKTAVEEFNCRTGLTLADFNGSVVYVDRTRAVIRKRYGEPARIFTEYDKETGKIYDVESYRGTAIENVTSYKYVYDHAFQKDRYKSVTEKEEVCIWLWIYYEQGKDIVVKVHQGMQK